MPKSNTCAVRSQRMRDISRGRWSPSFSEKTPNTVRNPYDRKKPILPVYSGNIKW